jgi:hypothetical protein
MPLPPRRTPPPSPRARAPGPSPLAPPPWAGGPGDGAQGVLLAVPTLLSLRDAPLDLPPEGEPAGEGAPDPRQLSLLPCDGPGR